MELTRPELEKILKTLPLSYYFPKSKCTVEIDDKAETSYCHLVLNKIYISFPAMKAICARITPNESAETFIRSNLYHELSHAILTPKEGLLGNNKFRNSINNVFEDERIETILKNFYIDVDFKRNIILLNGWKGEPPRNAFDCFYQTVRFRSGKKEHLKKVENMITKWKLLNNETEYLSSYPDEIWRLYLEIAKDYLEENEPDKLNKTAEDMYGPSEDEGGDGAGGSGNKGDIPDGGIYFEDEEDKKESSGSAGSSTSGAEGEEKESGEEGKGGKSKKEGKYNELNDYYKSKVVEKICNDEGTGDGDQVGVTIVFVEGGIPTDSPGSIDWDSLTDEQKEKLKDLIEKAKENQTSQSEAKPEETQKVLSTYLNRYVDSSLTLAMERIIENFMSRQKNNGACTNGWSGRLDPRLVGRKDWRVFVKKADQGIIRGYDKLHLILYIDVSGSYYQNETKTNTILRSLDDIEAKNPWFNFDLVTMSVGEVARSKEERYIKTGGGNRLDEKIWDISRRLNRPNELNYSIVLFDGDAFTDCWSSSKESYKRNFGAFNNTRTTIISDSSNEATIIKYAPQAYRKITNSRTNYSAVLFDNILEALNKILL